MFIKFKPYSINQTPPYIDCKRVVRFELISYNGNLGTELTLDSGCAVRVGELPDEVAKKINEVKSDAT